MIVQFICLLKDIGYFCVQIDFRSVGLQIRPNGNPTERDITFELINALLYGKEVIIIVAGGEHKKRDSQTLSLIFFTIH